MELARVILPIFGYDGQTWLAIIKTNNSELLRPVKLLFRLKIEIAISEKSVESVPVVISRSVKPSKK